MKSKEMILEFAIVTAGAVIALFGLACMVEHINDNGKTWLQCCGEVACRVLGLFW